jgi:CheY-like chemotaxis protein
VAIRVSDTGIGMSAETQTRLFGKFEQGDASTTRRFGGTGLGLAICQELVRLLGGAIDVESQEGRGSVFRLWLPLERLGDEAGDGDGETMAADMSSALRVLAAEDNPINQLVLTTLLQQVGVEPQVVADGAQALAAWRSGDWDVILMDVQMPVMDGPTAARAIRDEEALTGRPRTPIIALTANAMTHQVESYAACGMDSFVAKPIEAQKLFEALANAVGPSDPPSATEADAPSRAAER